MPVEHAARSELAAIEGRDGSSRLPRQPLFRPHLRAVASAAPLINLRAAAGGVPIFLGLFLAHQWGRPELAAFTVAHAAVMIAVAITDWGATRALPRNLATLPPGAAAEHLAAANALRLGISRFSFRCVRCTSSRPTPSASVWWRGRRAGSRERSPRDC